ncbi:MAG: hypothetical protein ACRCT1_16445 [Microcoleaceae cyanobacterium]
MFKYSRRKKEEGRRKKEERRKKKEEGRKSRVSTIKKVLIVFAIAIHHFYLLDIFQK